MPAKSSKKKIEKVNVDALLAKANEPKENAAKYHPFYKGKIEITPKAPVRTFDDFAIWYSPGVAQPCLMIKADKSQVFNLTNRWNTIAVISDGTRVLGLGNIGPEAGLPVMEGKSMLFKFLGGVDAFPLCLGTKNRDEIIQAVKWLQPSLGGVNLEDIESPKCYDILDTLRKELEIPVWHDDQQGTALVTVAGFINALKVVGKKMNEVSVAVVGAGAANSNIVKYLGVAGADLKKFYVNDSKGLLNLSRLDSVKDNSAKVYLAKATNKEGRSGGLEESIKGADAIIAASTPGPGVIKKEWVTKMADDAIIFACANPIPEIWPWEAKEAGARIVATGRSDFENQVNNSLGFPAVFRGTLDVSAKTITDEMCIAGAYAVAKYAEKKGLTDNYIIPTMSETGMFIEEAVAVGLKAMEQGIARKKISRKELEERATEIITRAQATTKLLMKNNIILPPPK
ncbi:MAG: NADP-dependent malic enzyme [Candidatus Bathyarchaeota archaeon]